MLYNNFPVSTLNRYLCKVYEKNVHTASKTMIGMTNFCAIWLLPQLLHKMFHTILHDVEIVLG